MIVTDEMVEKYRKGTKTEHYADEAAHEKTRYHRQLSLSLYGP
jgi:hypothetical protein